MNVSAYSKPAGPSAGTTAIDGTARTDCGAILNTAFRSPEERDWYAANCSHWPALKFDAPVAKLDPACDAMRGKPYANPDARNWYLKNCSGNDANQASADPNAAPVAPAPPAQDAPPPPPPAAPVVADRHDCNAIRSTGYTSNTELAWYNANCMGPQTYYPNSPYTNTPYTNTTSASSGPAVVATPVGRTPQQPQTQQPGQVFTIQTTTLCSLPIGAVDASLQSVHKQVCGN